MVEKLEDALLTVEEKGKLALDFCVSCKEIVGNAQFVDEWNTVLAKAQDLKTRRKQWGDLILWMASHGHWAMLNLNNSTIVEMHLVVRQEDWQALCQRMGDDG